MDYARSFAHSDSLMDFIKKPTVVLRAATTVSLFFGGGNPKKPYFLGKNVQIPIPINRNIFNNYSLLLNMFDSFRR